MDDAKAVNIRTVLKPPTDLKASNVKAIAVAVNGLIADAFALYVKTKNFHWHLSGPNFRDFHLMLDEQADQIFASIDPMAERIRKLGGSTLKSISHISKLQSLEDNNEDFVGPLEMLKELTDDNKKMAEAMRNVHDICDDNDDYATASLLEVFIDETERRLWFLFETSQGGEVHTR